MSVIELGIRTSKQIEMLDITPQVNKVLQENKIDEGICCIYSPHTTCGLTINEHADPSVAKDIMETLDKIVPLYGSYHHLEGNAAAHIKTVLVGTSVNLLVAEGHALLGTWQGIFLCEFDGPRQRKIWIKVIQR
ncbi:MAG: secondary thiamine-phosphate synthase enzyme YjbQ [Syntrophaceticus sp.]